jgi:uncharacterized membrane protein
VSRIAVAALARRVLVTTLVFALLDYVWLGLLMGDFYRRHLADLARLSGNQLDPVWWAAILVYAVLIVGIVAFVLPRAGRSPGAALAWGALFGLVTYGTYDLTCQAVLRDWPVVMTVVDMLWGATICGVSSAVVVAVDRRYTPPDARSTPASSLQPA